MPYSRRKGEEAKRWRGYRSLLLLLGLELLDGGVLDFASLDNIATGLLSGGCRGRRELHQLKEALSPIIHGRTVRCGPDGGTLGALGRSGSLLSSRSRLNALVPGRSLAVLELVCTRWAKKYIGQISSDNDRLMPRRLKTHTLHCNEKGTASAAKACERSKEGAYGGMATSLALHMSNPEP